MLDDDTVATDLLAEQKFYILKPHNSFPGIIVPYNVVMSLYSEDGFVRGKTGNSNETEAEIFQCLVAPNMFSNPRSLTKTVRVSKETQ